MVSKSSVPVAPWIPPPKLYRIGEVIRYSGFSRQTVHNYTTMGLITEQERTSGGHRMYGEETFRRLEVIRSLKSTRTLEEIRRIFETQDLASASAMAEGDSVSDGVSR